jgi:anhydro-N-acetylmuramic acid kinase
MRRRFIGCGLMSGTSRDGVDVAVTEITGRFPANKIKILHAETQAYPASVRALLLRATRGLTAEDVATLDFLLGGLYGQAVLKALRRAHLKPGDIDAIGSHGQTLLHRPRGVMVAGRRVASTLQVGSGAVIAQTTGILTVSDFRSADIAVGGEGAPLVPVYDYVVLRSRTASRIALNIGGIANLTALPRRARIGDISSFDTGPGNSLIDSAVGMVTRGKQRCDRNGTMALSGKPDMREVRTILKHPYFRRQPPKSTGWSEFGEEFASRAVTRMKRRGLSRDAIVSTVTCAVGRSIAEAIRSYVLPRLAPDEIVVTGGGCHNPVLMAILKEAFPRACVDPGEAFGISSDGKEACAFAYLAYLNLKGIPANVISQNSGLRPAVLGVTALTY